MSESLEQGKLIDISQYERSIGSFSTIREACGLKYLSGEEASDLVRVPLSQLVREAWEALNMPFPSNQLPDEYDHLRKVHAEKLYQFWQGQLFQVLVENVENPNSDRYRLSNEGAETILYFNQVKNDPFKFAYQIHLKQGEEEHRYGFRFSPSFDIVDGVFYPPQGHTSIADLVRSQELEKYEYTFRKGALTLFKKFTLIYTSKGALALTKEEVLEIERYLG